MNVIDVQVALRVIDVDYCVAVLVRLEHIFVEGSSHSRLSLSTAAPGWDVVLIGMSDVLLISVSSLSKYKNLLVSH